MGCAGCDNCQMDKVSKDPIYQLHVTIDIAEGTDASLIQGFKDACKGSDCEPIFIYNITTDGEYLDAFTNTICHSHPLINIIAIEGILKKAGLCVIRSKIEQTPWGYGIPEHPQEVDKTSGYWEAHMKFDATIPNEILWKCGLLISRNPDKPTVKMATLRRFQQTKRMFYEELADLKLHLPIQKTIVEYTTYDTNLSHDSHWSRNSSI